MRIAIAGCTGRMGRMLLDATMHYSNCQLTAAFTRNNNELAGKTITTLIPQHPHPFYINDNPVDSIDYWDAVIDFTSPEYTLNLLKITEKYNKIHIIGTTGLEAQQEQSLQKASIHIPIVYSANMSIGVMILSYLTQEASRLLGIEYDIEIVEMHHKHKKDAPSGSALMLGRSAAKGREISLEQHAVYTRHGQNALRQTGDIGFATLRGGDVIGDHSVIFAGPGERIELTHKSSNRNIYAYGAIRAALWAFQHKKPGLYNMNDVLFSD
jgi:4-hydroxy-tetrahydrodipicolinate reductase